MKYCAYDLILPMLELPTPCPVEITLDEKYVRLFIAGRDWQWDRATGIMVGCGTNLLGANFHSGGAEGKAARPSAEMNEQVALRLGYEIVARDWPCGYEPGCGYYEAARSEYDDDGNCLFILDETKIDSWHTERGLVMKGGNNVVPVPAYSTDDGLAMELFKRLAAHAARPGLCLEAVLGKYRIVIDNDAIPDSERWKPTIAEAVTKAFIALMPQGGTK